MKYFSLSFKLDEHDYQNYNRILTKAILLSKAKFFLLPVIAIIVGLSIFDILDVYSAIIMALIAPVFLFTTVLLNKEYYRVTFKKSKIIKRYLTVDFYDDHIEEKYTPDEYMNGYTERHYSFKDVLHIAESKENFFFLLNDNTMLNIPKRALNEETYGMIKNLINNLFSNKFEIL